MCETIGVTFDVGSYGDIRIDNGYFDVSYLAFVNKIVYCDRVIYVGSVIGEFDDIESKLKYYEPIDLDGNAVNCVTFDVPINLHNGKVAIATFVISPDREEAHVTVRFVH